MATVGIRSVAGWWATAAGDGTAVVAVGARGIGANGAGLKGGPDGAHIYTRRAALIKYMSPTVIPSAAHPRET